MTHPYRTAPIVAPQRPWWRRLLCAVGRHALFIDPRETDLHWLASAVRCEHCACAPTVAALDLYELVAAMRGMGAACQRGDVSKRDAQQWLDRSRSLFEERTELTR